MSETRPMQDSSATQPALSDVLLSSQSQPSQSDSCDNQQVKQVESSLDQGLSLMSVSELKATVAKKGKRTRTGRIKRSRTHSATPSKRPQGAMNTVANLVKLGRCKNIVVVVGAGISTASGIPDFRTPGTGLYSNLEKYNIPFPEAVFNIDYFTNNPQPFFSLAKELYPGRHRPNYIHYFIRMLHLKDVLLRVYTQNIDGLEKMCGIPEDKLVEAHGSFTSASCHLCYTPYPAQEAKAAIMSGVIPTCSFCQGAVKPDIVFFGEDLPQSYFLHHKDFPKADLLIVMGTSLQIEPFASLVNTVKSTVPRLLLNRNTVGPFLRVPLRRNDHVELGDLTNSVKRFAEVLGWHKEICHLMDMHEQEPVFDDCPTNKLKSFPTASPGTSNTENSDSETDSKSTESSVHSN